MFFCCAVTTLELTGSTKPIRPPHFLGEDEITVKDSKPLQ